MINNSKLINLKLPMWNHCMANSSILNNLYKIKLQMWCQPAVLVVDVLHKALQNKPWLENKHIWCIFFLQTSSRGSNYHEAMMALRDSSTSPAVSLCWGSNTSSFRIRHTVFSDTRPSLRGGGGQQEGTVLITKCDYKSQVHNATIKRLDYTAISSGPNWIWKCGKFSANVLHNSEWRRNVW